MKIQSKILLIVLLTLCTLIPCTALAQVKGSEQPTQSALESMYQNPARWSGARFAEPHSFLDRFYVNISGDAGQLWNRINYVDNSAWGANAHLDLGLRLSPVHLIEVGYGFGVYQTLESHHTLNVAYLFDVTSYASRLEEPGKWQLFIKGGVEMPLDKDKTPLALVGATRLQYNASPIVGLYLEPKLTLYGTPNYTPQYESRGFAYTSIALGASFRMGALANSDVRFAIKTNLLYDLATALNIGLEIPIKARWSIALDHTFPWWIFNEGRDGKSGCRFELLDTNLEGRYWFGDRTKRDQLTGWFAGLYAGGGKGDFEYKSEGYQSRGYGSAGLSAGYAHTINRSGNLRLEYALSAGYLNSEYRYYKTHLGIDDNIHVIRQHTGDFTWMGPTRAKISLVWLINGGKSKKGGKL